MYRSDQIAQLHKSKDLFSRDPLHKHCLICTSFFFVSSVCFNNKLAISYFKYFVLIDRFHVTKIVWKMSYENDFRLADNVATDKPVHPVSLARKHTCPLISQYNHYLQINGLYSFEIRPDGYAGWIGATLSACGILMGKYELRILDRINAHARNFDVSFADSFL